MLFDEMADLDFWDGVSNLIRAMQEAYRNSDDNKIDESVQVGELVIPALLEKLGEGDARMQSAAIWMFEVMKELIIAGGKPAGSLTSITDALNHRDAGIRRAAIRALGWIEAKESVPTLQKFLEEDTDRAVRRAAIESLGRIGDVAAMPPLVKALHDDASSVRYAAAWALGRIGDPNAVVGLLSALRDPDADVRRSAARALGWIGHEGAVTGLVGAMEDERSGVRRDAAWALGRIGDREAVPSLLTALRDHRETVRYAASWALGRIGDPEALPGLLGLLHDEDRDVRRAAAEALREIGDTRAIPGLLNALRSAQRNGDSIDVYSVGVVIYEMLTATAPVEARAFGQKTARLIDPVTDIGLPVREMIGDRRSIDADQRKAMSAGELVRRIEELISGEMPPDPDREVTSTMPEPISPDATVVSADDKTPPQASKVRPAFVLVTEDNRVIPLDKDEVILGRKHARDTIAPDIDLGAMNLENARTVSRRHCRVFLNEGDFFIEDLESMNGTSLNNDRLVPGQAYRLRPDDRLRVGQIPLTFRAEADKSQAES